MRTATEIVNDCYEKCDIYRMLEKDLLGGIEYEYSVSEEVQESLEKLDPTGRELEKHCTNLDEVKAHDEAAAEVLNKHILSCGLDCCKELRLFRKAHDVPGYEEVEN